MAAIQRPYRGADDQAHMLRVVHAEPQANVHVVDLPYRFSSWAFDNPSNVALWEDETGELRAWAVLQTPFWALDYAYHPAAPATIHTQILAWADEQAQAQVGSAYGRPIWFVNVFDWQTTRQAELAAAGFVCVADWPENPWSKVLLRHDPTQIISPLALPAGYTLRPLQGAAEVAAYVALHRAVFESESMTVPWRARTLGHPTYQPEVDLVITDAQGDLAAFCIGWFTANGLNGQPTGQIEPLGVRADVRGQGVGQIILQEVIHRLYTLGAKQVIVETDKERSAALALYEKVGFRVSENVLVFRKDYAALSTP